MTYTDPDFEEILLALSLKNPILAIKIEEFCDLIEANPLIGELAIKRRRNFITEDIIISYNYHPKGEVEFVSFRILPT